MLFSWKKYAAFAEEPVNNKSLITVLAVVCAIAILSLGLVNTKTAGESYDETLMVIARAAEKTCTRPGVSPLQCRLDYQSLARCFAIVLIAKENLNDLLTLPNPDFDPRYLTELQKIKEADACVRQMTLDLKRTYGDIKK